MADLKRPDVTPNRRQGRIKISAASFVLTYALLYAFMLCFWSDGEHVPLAIIRLWSGATALGLPGWVSLGVFSALAKVAAFVLPPMTLSVFALQVPWWIWILFCLLASYVIELLQMTVLPPHEPTLLDVEANSSGGLLGTLFGRAVVRLVGRVDPVTRTL